MCGRVEGGTERRKTTCLSFPSLSQLTATTVGPTPGRDSKPLASCIRLSTARTDARARRRVRGQPPRTPAANAAPPPRGRCGGGGDALSSASSPSTGSPDSARSRALAIVWEREWAGVSCASLHPASARVARPKKKHACRGFAPSSHTLTRKTAPASRCPRDTRPQPRRHRKRWRPRGRRRPPRRRGGRARALAAVVGWPGAVPTRPYNARGGACSVWAVSPSVTHAGEAVNARGRPNRKAGRECVFFPLARSLPPSSFFICFFVNPKKRMFFYTNKSACETRQSVEFEFWGCTPPT